MTTSTMTASTRSTLSIGSTGGEVRYLQILLNSVFGDVLAADGVFGEETEEQVQRFQSACLLLPDGVVGSQTWAYLEELAAFSESPHPTLRKGSTGGEVKYLQAKLNAFLAPKLSDAYTSLKVDGDFGSKTEETVKRFQSIHAIEADGIVGAQTWGYLENFS